MLLALTGLAMAHDCRQSLTENGFRDLVVDARDAVDRGDLPTVLEVLGQIEARVPCLDAVVERRLVADLWAIHAIVAFAQDEDWETPLGSALRDRPNLDRMVGRTHPIWSWEPGQPEPLGPLSPRATVYLDGEPLTGMPEQPGYYLLQKYGEDTWNSTLVLGGTPARAWLEEPVQLPKALVVEGAVYGGVASWIGQQSLDWATDPGTASGGSASPWAVGPTEDGRRGTGTFTHPIGTLAFRGRVWLYVPAAVEISASTAIGADRAQRDLRAVAFGTIRRAEIGIGLAAREVLLYRYDGPITTTGAQDVALLAEARFLNFLVGRVGFRFGNEAQDELYADVAFRPNGDNALTVRLTHDLRMADPRGIRLQLGGWVDTGASRFRALRIDDHVVTARTLQVGLLLGGRFRRRL